MQFGRPANTDTREVARFWILNNQADSVSSLGRPDDLNRFNHQFPTVTSLRDVKYHP